MRVPVWVHHVGTSYAQSALGFDDSAVPAIGEVWGKVFDGLHFMSTYDRHTAAISGLEVVVQRERMHEAEGGREWKPWGVARGRQPGTPGDTYAMREGELAAAAAKAGAGPGERRIVILDVEPHYHGGTTPQFWRGDLGADGRTVRALLDTFLGEGGEEVWLSLDARSAHLAPISFRDWAEHPAVTRVLPQTYWTDFGRPWRESIDRANALLASHGVRADRVAHVLPGNAKAQELSEAIEHCHGAGNLAPSVWQRQTLTPEVATAIHALDDPWASAPPAPRVMRTDLERVGALLAEAQGEIERLKGVAG